MSILEPPPAHQPATLPRARVLCFSDSDSFLKWGVHLVDAMPAHWSTRLIVIRGSATPSVRQIETAVEGTRFSAADVRIVSPAEAIETYRRVQPSVLVAAARGFSVITFVERMLKSSDAPRPVIVSGLPGISTPVLPKGIRYRRYSDLFLLQSKHEIREHEAWDWHGVRPRAFALSTLPFLSFGKPARIHPLTEPEAEATRDEVVFAVQSKVPAAVDDRRRIIRGLARAAAAHPHLRFVIKVRALHDETQTHPEPHPYPALLAEERENGLDVPENLVVDSHSMRRHVARAVGVVTVSSTAILEAIDAGVPCLALSDFGVGPDQINTVFVGSGLFGSINELPALNFRHPRAEWLDDNYFHPDGDNTWLPQLEGLLAERAAGTLPDVAFLPNRGLNRFRRGLYVNASIVPEHPGIRYRLEHAFWEAAKFGYRFLRRARRRLSSPTGNYLIASPRLGVGETPTQ